MYTSWYYMMMSPREPDLNLLFVNHPRSCSRRTRQKKLPLNSNLFHDWADFETRTFFLTICETYWQIRKILPNQFVYSGPCDQMKAWRNDVSFLSRLLCVLLWRVLRWQKNTPSDAGNIQMIK